LGLSHSNWKLQYLSDWTNWKWTIDLKKFHPHSN
jgi:hypothetical protein